ncbi:hypothetical protein NQ318_000283 [Aromia moschata]|uniref:Uncharacterized protein n=1 Tax=Aromia moschata TaxID=1265417 RepID=A0AAV8YVU0_9CUCU|nr:hypothetical protein NQ318_000283 [Aromia moschata]
MNQDVPNHRLEDHTPIERLTTAGPERLTTAGPTTLTPELTHTTNVYSNKEKISPVNIPSATTLTTVINPEDDKPAAALFSSKKPFKDTTVTDGKINIITQVTSEKEALCCKYSEDFEYIAAGYTNGEIKIYQSSSGEHVLTLSDDDVVNHIAPVTNIKHRPSSKAYPISNTFTATYANGYVKCWSYVFKQCLYTIKENRQTYGITYHPKFPKLITYGDDQKIYFYDEESKVQERIMMPSEMPNTHDGHMSRIFAACFHPRNHYEFISGGWDSVVQFWDLRQPFAVRHLSGIHMCGEGLDINMKGTEVLTCAYQKNGPTSDF